MNDKNGWYVVEIVRGPLSDAELVELARSSQLQLSTVITHSTKTGGKLIEARKVRDIRKILDNKPQAKENALFEFKGEVLGQTTLEEYKRRHHRKCGGHNLPAPQTSERMDKSALFSIYAQEWYMSANIVTARIAFPFERVSEPFSDKNWMAVAGEPLTVAGTKVQDLVHTFIDGVLFKIHGFFDAGGFTAVRDGFKTKFGKPGSSRTESYQNAYGATFKGECHVWSNGVCTLLLEEFGGDRELSSFGFVHDALAAECDRRKPPPTTHDL